MLSRGLCAYCNSYKFKFLFQHNYKKVRNSLMSKEISTPDGKILWKDFVKAYEWDRDNNSMRIHYKLSPSHIHPDKSEKMRNHLATEMLNTDMLNLFKEHQEATEAKHLSGVIQLLTHTSMLVSIFSDKRPIRSKSDERLHSLSLVLAYLRALYSFWQEKGSEKDKFFTRECYNDLISMITGVLKVVSTKLSLFPKSSVYLHRLNSDVCENIFCSARGICNGSNTNPSYYKYCKSINTIIIGQAVTSKKSNAKSNVCVGGALPFKCYTGESFKKLNEH